MTQTKKLRPGFARIQFIAIAQKAHELMAMGHTIQSAFEELRKENKITMTYDSFRKHLKGNKNNNDEKKEAEAKKEFSSPQSRARNEQKDAPKIISVQSSSFSDDIPIKNVI